MINRKVDFNERRYCSTSTFQQHLYFRKKEAERSILIELNSKTYVPHATFTCEQYGAIKNIYSYRGVSENVSIM